MKRGTQKLHRLWAQRRDRDGLNAPGLRDFIRAIAHDESHPMKGCARAWLHNKGIEDWPPSGGDK